MTVRGVARLVPVAVLLTAATALAAAVWRFPVDPGEAAGPGTMPMGLCAALAVLAVARGVQIAREESASGGIAASARPSDPDEMRGGHFWIMPALCAAYVVVLPRLGFISSTALLAAALLAASGHRRMGRALAFGVVLAVILYTVFAVWMQLPLPEGCLG